MKEISTGNLDDVGTYLWCKSQNTQLLIYIGKIKFLERDIEKLVHRQGSWQMEQTKQMCIQIQQDK